MSSPCRRDLRQSSRKLEGTIKVTFSGCFLTGVCLHMYDYKTRLRLYVNIPSEAWRAGGTPGKHDWYQTYMC